MAGELEPPNRPYYFPGVGYPAEPDELESLLSDLLSEPVETSGSQTGPRASIFPHIDFFRCQETYKAGYQHLHSLAIESLGPLTVVVLGISHAESSTPFVLTKAHFETPIGLVETDREAVDALARDLPFDPFEAEENHLTEHSVELHTLLLKRLLGGRREFSIVPVLCYNFDAAIEAHHSPTELPGVSEFIANLKDLVASKPNVHVLASVDLSHMGLEYEGKRLTHEFLRELEIRDRESLAAVEGGLAEEFFATHLKDGGERNYCGTPAIYTILRLFPEKFTLHRYQQSTRPDLGSTVTVCSATLP